MIKFIFILLFPFSLSAMQDPDLTKKILDIKMRYNKLWDSLSESQASVEMFEAIEKNKADDIERARLEYERRRLRLPQIIPPMKSE